MSLPPVWARHFFPYLSTFFSFSAIQAAQVLLPLLALPWLARVLGPEAFGLLMYMGIISVAVGLVMDWGFALGAVRDVAAQRAESAALAMILGQVLSAKALLAGACLLSGLVLLPWLPHATAHPFAYGLALLGGLSRGGNPTWFFQGRGEGMRRMALWDVGGSLLVLLLTFLLVRQAADWPLYLALLAGCKGATYCWLTRGLLRSHAGVIFSVRQGWAALGRSRMLFMSVLSSLVYTNGAQLILGYFLAPAQMGVLLTADKIARAVVSLSNPVTQTLFPEICALRGTGLALTARLLRVSLAVTGGVMLCAAAAVWLCSPWLIRLALGPDYASAVPVLRIMVFFIPLLACNMVLGTQTLVSSGQERALTATLACTAVFSVPAALLLGHWGGLTGGAALPLLVEAFIFAALSVHVARLCPEVFLLRRSGRASGLGRNSEGESDDL